MGQAGEIIKESRSKAELSVVALAKKAGISETYLYMIEKGQRVPSETAIFTLSKHLDFDLQEVSLLARAERSVLEEEKEFHKAELKKYKESLKVGQDAILETVLKLASIPDVEDANIFEVLTTMFTHLPEITKLKLSPELFSSVHVTIPMASQKVDGGTGQLLVDTEIISELAFRKDWISRYGGVKDKIILRVTGDSMEKLIHDGDVVLIDQSESGKKVMNNEVYVVNDPDNGLVVKYVRSAPFGLMLSSENHDLYKPYPLLVEKGQVSPVVGRVIWWSHEIGTEKKHKQRRLFQKKMDEVEPFKP